MFADKNERKYFGVLRRLAKLDSSIFNKLKVTVCEGEFNEEKQCFLVAPLMVFNSDNDLKNKNSSKKSAEKNNGNSTEQSEISYENNIESYDDYPDSSDFSNDE